jgi:hypothetical protein
LETYAVDGFVKMGLFNDWRYFDICVGGEDEEEAGVEAFDSESGVILSDQHSSLAQGTYRKVVAKFNENLV